MDEQQLQQQIVQLVQMAMQGDQQATKQIEQIMQAAQQGDQQAMQLAQMIQQVAQQLQSQQQEQVRAAKFGAKLDYIKQLRGQCPEGYEMRYFKEGGQLCKKCVKRAMEQGGEMPSNPVDAFKCGKKMKKKACGGLVEKDKCGKKIRKSAGGDDTADYSETTGSSPRMRVPKNLRSSVTDKVRTPYGIMDRTINSYLTDMDKTLVNDTIYTSNDPSVYFSLPTNLRTKNSLHDIYIPGGERVRTSNSADVYNPGILRGSNKTTSGSWFGF